MAIGITIDLLPGGFLKLSPYQMLVGGVLTFMTHRLGTGLPVMIFIYAILFPRYLKCRRSPLLYSAAPATRNIFEYWTLYDSLPHGALSIIFVILTFFPPGLMKSHLTLRTANAWVHLWGLPRHYATRHRRHAHDRSHLRYR